MIHAEYRAIIDQFRPEAGPGSDKALCDAIKGALESQPLGFLDGADERYRLGLARIRRAEAQEKRLGVFSMVVGQAADEVRTGEAKGHDDLFDQVQGREGGYLRLIKRLWHRSWDLVRDWGKSACTTSGGPANARSGEITPADFYPAHLNGAPASDQVETGAAG